MKHFNGVIEKLRDTVRRIKNSPKKATGLHSVNVPNADPDEVEQTRNLVLIEDVHTRWNSTYAMLERAIAIRLRLDTYCRIDRDLQSFSEAEWDELQQLCELLQMFAEATKRMSAELYPTLTLVVPLFNAISDELGELAEIHSHNPVSFYRLLVHFLSICKGLHSCGCFAQILQQNLCHPVMGDFV